MKRHTMLLVLSLAMVFAYASAKAQQPMGGRTTMGGQTGGMQNPNSPNNPNNPNNPGGVDMGPNGPNQQPQADNTPQVSDSDLQNAVKSKLAADPAFANVQAAVEKGKVTLDGTVNSKDDKKKAKNAVKSIAGVRGVKEHLTVSGKESPAQDQQKQRPSAAGPGMAFLSPQDAAQGSSSSNTAGSIAGNSQTSANPTSAAPQASTPEAGSMQQSGTTPSSSGSGMLTLQNQIQTKIKNDPTLTNSTVSVNVGASSIDLSGTVGSSQAKARAERIAQSYAQNRKVTNNLQVTGAGDSDLSNGHSAMSNGATQTQSTPKGTSSQMPQSDSPDKSDQNAPR